MMSTPTPASRRPRPPGSIANSRLSSSTSSSASATNTTEPSASPLSPGNDAQKQSFAFHQRRAAARSSLSRISPSPSDIGNVSLGLDVTSPPRRSSPAPRSLLGLGVSPSVPIHHPHPPTDETVQPSPPPPYGQELPDPTPVPKAAAVTPPRQDSAGQSDGESVVQEGRVEQEERLRARRAADAAKAIGLDMDFGVSNSGGDDSSELEEDEEDLRNRLRSVRRRLRQRDKELLMAAQVADQALRQHEQVLSQLSPTAKSHPPQLLTLLAVAPAARAQNTSRPPSRAGSHLSDKVSPPSSRFRHSTSHSVASISSILSPTFGRHSPGIDQADNSPDRPGNFKVVNGQPGYYRKASRPRVFHTNASPTQRYHLLQAEEAEQRIMALEAALMEAQAGEENQRKAAARMRRDHDKLKRDLERAEGMLSENQTISGLPRAVGSRGQRERTEGPGSARPKSWYDPRHAHEQETEMVEDILHESDGEEERQLRRNCTIPVPSRPASRATSERREASHEGGRDDRELSRHQSTAGSSSRPLHLPIPPASPSWESVMRGQGEHQRAPKPVSRSSFLSPPKYPSAIRAPLTPSLRIQSPGSLEPLQPKPPTRDSTSRARPRARFSRSPSHDPQSPSAPLRTSPSPARSLTSIASTFAQSPGFTSISNRMASMREFVADSLFLAPTTRMSRTLGSELGSEFGDDWEGPAWARSASLAPESPAHHVGGSSQGQDDAPSQDSDEVGVGNDEGDWVDESETGSGEDDQTTVFNSPAALPALASAALSSLALALAPTDLWDYSTGDAAPILPRGCLRDRQVDGRTYDLLGQAVKGRRIVWADTPPSNPSDLTFGQAGPRIVRPRRPSSPSPRPSHAQRPSLGRMPSGDRGSGFDLAWEHDVQGSDGSEEEANCGEASVIGLSLKGKAPNGRSGLGVMQRPKAVRAGSSQSSIALAHRRVSNQSYLAEVRSGDVGVVGMSKAAGSEASGYGDAGEAWVMRDPRTIPGKVVHDLLVWALILMEWLECLAVLGIKVVIDLRRGRDGVLGRQLRIQANRRRRYYL